MLTLPPLPPHVGTLLNDESRRLNAQHPDLPASPDRCRTCGGLAKFPGRRDVRTFLWFDRYSPSFNPANPQVTEYLCPCDDQWIAERWLLSRGVHRAQATLGWADAVGVDPSIRQEVLEYITHAGGFVAQGIGMIMRSTTKGTGKSMMAVLTLKTLMAQGFDGHFLTFAETLNYFRDTWASPEDKAWYAARIRNTQILVIDDIGREHMRQFADKESGGMRRAVTSVAESTIDDLIRHRLFAAKPTIITTNASMDDIEAKYGDNISSLLEERSITLEFNNASWRSEATQRSINEVKQGLSRPVVFE